MGSLETRSYFYVANKVPNPVLLHLDYYSGSYFYVSYIGTLTGNDL